MHHDVSSLSLGSGGSSEGSGWLEAAKEAKGLAAKGEIRQAVSLFKEGCKHAGTGREQFLWRLQEARFWQETGHLEIAVPQIESLDDEADRHQLEQWEPELSFQIAALLLVWYKRMESKDPLPPERVARKERMHSRVSRLDAARAMDLLVKGK
jgi:type VI secretion system protein VasJ